VVLGNVDSTGALTISTTSGALTQAANATVRAGSTTNLTVQAANVTLDNTGNNLVGLISVSNAANLTLRSTALTMNSVTTSGTQTYNSPVVLPADTTLAGTQVSFNQSVVGIGSLTINGASVLNGATISTTGAQIYNGAVTLSKNTTLTTGGNAGVNFVSTINGEKSLTVNSAGATVFGGEVGTDNALTSLTTDQHGTVEINGGKVKTTGAQTYNEIATLGATTTLQGVNVALMSTVDVIHALTINDSGTTVLGGSIGGTTPLLSLTTDSLTTAAGETHIKGAGIYTTTNAVFHDIVKIFNDVTVRAAGQMTFAQTLNGDTAGTRSLTLDGGTSSAITVTGAVGATMPLNTLEVVNSASTAFNGGLTASTLTVGAHPFGLTLRGNVAVTNAVNLINTGPLQLGAVASDDLFFAGLMRNLRIVFLIFSNNWTLMSDFFV
jgi:hypothetical protein